VWTFKNSMHVRRLWPSDLPAFKAHLQRLDRETLFNRFGGYPAKAFLDSYARQCIADGGVVFGYFDDGLLRGAGELRHDDETLDGEAAFSVEPSYRRQGIGSALFMRVIGAARNRRIKTLSILCLPHNQAMIELARKFEAELYFENDEITGHLVARDVTPLSLWHEYVDDGIGLFGAFLDVQHKFWTSMLRKAHI